MSRWKTWRRDRAEAEAIARQSDSDEGETIPVTGESAEDRHVENDSPVVDDVCDYSEASDAESYTSFVGIPGGELSSENDTDSDIEADGNTRFDLHGKLGMWATKNNITRNSVTELLTILRESGHTDLPKDARTLLKTPKTVIIEDKCGGQYIYLGIENGIHNYILSRNPEYVHNTDRIDLKINVDGLPLFKSNSDVMWPILARFGKLNPFIVAMYYGKDKPNSVNEFMGNFVEESNYLNECGTHWEDRHLKVSLFCFICDAPARCFLKCIKGHTGYCACERCTVHGEWKGRVVYDTTEQDIVARSDDVFMQMGYQVEGHQSDVSPLSHCDVKCVTDFALDYMHLVCLGAMKRILQFFKNGPRCCKLGACQIAVISDSLMAFQGLMPSEFARQPRSLKELERWKATEYRQFLLYTGPVAFKNVLCKRAYTHFLSLSVAISLLLETDSETRNANVDYAEQLLTYFVNNCRKIYGKTFNVYNIHNLLHLSDDVRKFGCSLNDISAFPFENHLQYLKKMVRSSKNPIAQVVKRQHELQSFGTKESSRTRFKVSTNKKNGHFLLTCSEFCIIREIRENLTYVVDILNTSHAEDFFVAPCSSKRLNIVFIRNVQVTSRRLVEHEELDRKVVCLPYNGGFVLMPLLHDPEKL